MRILLYLIAAMLVAGWILGVFYWHAGGLIYLLLVLAVISVLLAIIRKK